MRMFNISVLGILVFIKNCGAGHLNTKRNKIVIYDQKMTKPNEHKCRTVSFYLVSVPIVHLN